MLGIPSWNVVSSVLMLFSPVYESEFHLSMRTPCHRKILGRHVGVAHIVLYTADYSKIFRKIASAALCTLEFC